MQVQTRMNQIIIITFGGNKAKGLFHVATKLFKFYKSRNL